MALPNASDEAQLCTFVVGDLLLGLPLEQVREVVPGDDLTPVPLAPPAVVGIFSLRGGIVTALDARVRMGLPVRDPHEATVHIIVTVEGDRTSLVVDRTSDVVTVTGADAEAVPETVPVGIRRLVTATYQRPQGLLLLLDPALLLSSN